MEMEPAADAASAAVPVESSGEIRCILRIKLPPAWTPEEDARLERLAKENAFRHWRRVAAQMPRRSSKQCRDRWRDDLARDVYHRPFTARDDDDLARLYLHHGGARWKDISRAVYGRSSRVMKRRWRELRNSDAFLRKLWRPLPSAPPLLPDAGMHIDLDSPPAPSSQHQYTDVLAADVASCGLSCDTVGLGAACTFLGLRLTGMAV